MKMLEIRDEEIKSIEKLLLPNGAHFPDDAIAVIRCWESKDVAACAGSGKTTVLLAKLKILSDRMPLENGAGICVLSHTNVAINELKAKMSDSAAKLMNYPNYVGTIQSFIDQYVTLPYLRSKYGKSVQVVDTRTYAEHLDRIVSSWKYKELTGLIIKDFNSGSGQFSDRIDYVGNMYIRDDGALCVQRRRSALAGPGKPSALQFRQALHDLLIQERMIKYSDAYQLAKVAVEELTIEYTELFSSRFPYVFIDEYQDCKEDQREVLAKLFDPDKCCVFHIGDSDQAIYGSDKDAVSDWQPSGQYLTLGVSNRYGQEIANVLRSFRTGQQYITSLYGMTGHRPVLFVYDLNTISLVKDQFIKQLDKHELMDERGIYKAIGHIRNKDAAGISIGSYWDGFDGRKKDRVALKYWEVIDDICDKLKEGQMYLVEPLIRALICRIFHYAKVINHKTKTEYTDSSLIEVLNDNYFDEYRDKLVEITELTDFSRVTVSAAFMRLMVALFSRSSIKVQDVMNKMPAYFMDDSINIQIPESERNVYIDPIYGRRIEFDTIHGVKGETHDATLYLETEMNRSSDIVRILPLLGVGRAGTSPLYDYSRKLVYVGMSRPRTLLCLAIQESTYVRSKTVFQEWDTIDLRNRG